MVTHLFLDTGGEVEVLLENEKDRESFVTRRVERRSLIKGRNSFITSSREPRRLEVRELLLETSHLLLDTGGEVEVLLEKERGAVCN